MSDQVEARKYPIYSKSHPGVLHDHTPPAKSKDNPEIEKGTGFSQPSTSVVAEDDYESESPDDIVNPTVGETKKVVRQADDHTHFSTTMPEKKLSHGLCGKRTISDAAAKSSSSPPIEAFRNSGPQDDKALFPQAQKRRRYNETQSSEYSRDDAKGFKST
jgi:hypothetical protein